MTVIWYGVQWREFWVFLDCFLPFYLLPNNSKNQNFEKIKKRPWRYYHFTQVYHKRKSYDVWFLRLFLSFWTVFCPFTAITTQKTKILKKWKKRLEILFLHTCTKNNHHILCGSWFGTQWKVLFFILGYFLHFSLPNSLKNQNF